MSDEVHLSGHSEFFQQKLCADSRYDEQGRRGQLVIEVDEDALRFQKVDKSEEEVDVFFSTKDSEAVVNFNTRHIAPIKGAELFLSPTSQKQQERCFVSRRTVKPKGNVRYPGQSAPLARVLADIVDEQTKDTNKWKGRKKDGRHLVIEDDPPWAVGSNAGIYESSISSSNSVKSHANGSSSKSPVRSSGNTRSDNNNNSNSGRTNTKDSRRDISSSNRNNKSSSNRENGSSHSSRRRNSSHSGSNKRSSREGYGSSNEESNENSGNRSAVHNVNSNSETRSRDASSNTETRQDGTKKTRLNFASTFQDFKPVLNVLEHANPGYVATLLDLLTGAANDPKKAQDLLLARYIGCALDSTTPLAEQITARNQLEHCPRFRTLLLQASSPAQTREVPPQNDQLQYEFSAPSSAAEELELARIKALQSFNLKQASRSVINTSKDMVTPGLDQPLRKISSKSTLVSPSVKIEQDL